MRNLKYAPSPLLSSRLPEAQWIVEAAIAAATPDKRARFLS